MPSEPTQGAPDEAEDEDYMAARRAEVREAVGRLIARAWMDDAFKRALIADPQHWLRAEGVFFPERYVIEFYEDAAAEPGDWHSVGRGSAAVHRFPIPPVPLGTDLATDPLGEDAAQVACCSPCASCTGAVSPESWR
jgi:hypothetical protein